jgi:hypothetical protein
VCDFFVAVTATFRVIYVFVVLEGGTRRILHWNVTAHPTANWTAQQFRMVVAADPLHRFVIHDRDAIYSEGVDATVTAMGLTVLKTPVRAPISERHSPPSTPELSSLWRAVAEDALSLQRSSAQRPIVPELKWDTAVPLSSLDESKVV